MSKFVVSSGDGTVTGNPSGDEDFYRYLRGLWRDDGPITYGGHGRGFTSTPVDFMYPGDPPMYWSMEDLDNAGSSLRPGDYVFMWSTGPFSLDVGESKELVIRRYRRVGLNDRVERSAGRLLLMAGELFD